MSAGSAADLAGVLAGTVVDAARRLLGRRLRTLVDGVVCEALLTEVEAYGGADDPASHAHRGRTARNAAMFGPPGTLYVYRSYGVHWCANVAVGPAGEPGAVLLRGGVAVRGEDAMRVRRRRADHLTDGPGKLTQALAITGEHDGTSVFDGPVRVVGEQRLLGPIVARPRVGVTRAADRPWRFVMATPMGSLPQWGRGRPRG